MKIKKIKSRLKIVKPFRVKKVEDYRYVYAGCDFYRKEKYCVYTIPKLGMRANSETWSEAKDELMGEIFHYYHVCVDCPKKKLGVRPLKHRKIFKKHIKERY